MEMKDLPKQVLLVNACILALLPDTDDPDRISFPSVEDAVLVLDRTHPAFCLASW